jgi:hypothetical protein
VQINSKTAAAGADFFRLGAPAHDAPQWQFNTAFDKTGESG